MQHLVDKMIDMIIQSHKHVVEDPTTMEYIVGVSTFPVTKKNSDKESYLLVSYTIDKKKYPDRESVEIKNIEESDKEVTDEMLDFYNEFKKHNARFINFTTDNQEGI